eukprot:EG_transcript_7720
MGFSALRVFEPKCQELQWSRVLAVDVAAFHEGRKTEADVKHLLDDLLPHLLQCFVARRAPEAAQPERLLQLFRVTQLLMELVNQDYEYADEEWEKCQAALASRSDSQSGQPSGDLPQRLSATAQDLRPSDDALARLRADNAQLAAQCEQLTGAVARLEDALTAREREALRAVEEAAELSRAVEAETERQLLDREAECGRVRAELTEVTEELHRTRERTQQLEGYGGASSEALQQKEAELQALQSQLRAFLMGTVTPGQPSHPHRGISCVRMAEQLDAVTRECSRLEDRLVRQEAEYATALAQLRALERKEDGLPQARQRIEALQVQLHRAEDAAAQFKLQLSEERFATATLTDWVERLKDLVFLHGGSIEEVDALKPAGTRPLTMAGFAEELRAREEEVERLQRERETWQQRSLRSLGDAGTLGLTALQLEWVHEYIDALRAGTAHLPRHHLASIAPTAEPPPASHTTAEGTTLSSVSSSGAAGLASDLSLGDSRLGPEDVVVPRAEWAALQAKAAAQAMQLQAVTAQWEAERRRAEEIAAAVAGDLKSVMREVLGSTFAHSVAFSVPAVL